MHRLISRPAITATLLGLGPLVAFLVWADLSGGAGASGRAVALWPANGIVEALLLTMPLRLWPACVAAGLLGNVAGDWLAGVPAALAVPLALCNTVEILITAGGLRHNLGEWPNPSRPLVLAEIWAFGALLAPAVSGMAAALVGLHGAPWVWFLAHGTSTAVVLPLALSLRRPAFWALLKPDRRLETGLIVGLCLVASAVAYLPLREPLSFLIFAPLLLAAVRLGIPGASLALALSAALGELTVLSRHAGQAGFAAPDGTDHVLFLQFFLAVTAATVLPLGAVTEERQRALAALRDSEARLAAANAELAALAMTDGLTGLANRRRFEDALAEEWQRAMRGATRSRCCSATSMCSKPTTTPTATWRAMTACVRWRRNAWRAAATRRPRRADRRRGVRRPASRNRGGGRGGDGRAAAGSGAGGRPAAFREPRPGGDGQRRRCVLGAAARRDARPADRRRRPGALCCQERRPQPDAGGAGDRAARDDGAAATRPLSQGQATP